MKKLFIFNNRAIKKYREELKSAYELYSPNDNSVLEANIDKINLRYFKNIDVVISNQLPIKWKKYLKKSKIVSIIIDKIKLKDTYADIYIDCLYKGRDKVFIGDTYSITNNDNLDVSFKEIFDLIYILKWDSSFWGFSVAFLSSRHLTENILYRVNLFIKRNKIRLVEYLCNCHDKLSVNLAEKNDFQFKDIRLTYEKSIKKIKNLKLKNGMYFSTASKKDISKLRKIGKDIYLDSRYYFDDNFKKSKVQEFYMNWVEKSVKKTFDDECYILLKKKNPIAYCSIKYLNNKESNIGLIGVDPEESGKGNGQIILNKVFNALYKKGIKRLSVASQGRNYSAQRLYQKAGFLTSSTELWYHKWLY